MKARAFACLGSLLLFATAVHGEPEKAKPLEKEPAAKAQPGTLAALPELPADHAVERPSRVPAGGAVRGLWVSAPRSAAATSDGRPTPMVIVSSVPLEVSFDNDKLRADTPGEIEACVRASDDGAGWTGVGRGATLLELNGRSRISVDDDKLAREAVRSEVSLVRAERIVEGDGGDATLERVEAWVDLRTGGAREVGRQSIPVALVRRFGALAVYGARQGDKAVFVVHPPKRPSDDGPSFNLQTGGGRRCGHAMVTASADRLGQTGSESLRGALTTAMDPEMKESETHGVTTRPFRIQLTASWLGAEPSPAIGASFGWVAPANPPPESAQPPEKRVRKPKK